MPDSGTAGPGNNEEERLEAIRSELRARGYLDSPLHRFLLRDVLRHHVSRARAILSLALRVGLVGGLLVGLPVAGAAFAIAGGRGGWSGLVLLALLLSVAFGVVLAGLEMITTLVLSSVWLRQAPGRASRLAARMAVVLGGVGAVYLGLWWRARRTQLGATGWLDLLSLVLITCLALGLARLTAVAGTLLVARAAVEGLPPVAQRPRRRLLPLALMLVAATATVVFIRWPGGNTGPAGPLQISAVPGRLLVIGIDGLGENSLDTLSRHNLMPVLRSVLEAAAVHPLSRIPSSDPPAVWTTYATGREPAEHGIAGAEWHSLAGIPAPVESGGALVTALAQAVDALLPLGGQLARPRPVSARIRRAPAVWEILGGQGIAVAVSHWWATSPLPDLPGCAASDRAFVLLAAGADVGQDLRPADDAAWWSANFASWREGLEPDEDSGEGKTSRAMMVDRFHAAHLLRCLEARQPDHGFLYLWSLDVARAESTPELSNLLAGAERVAAAARLVDGILGRILAGVRPGDRLVLLLDPGRTGPQGEGLMAVWGQDVVVGRKTGALEATRVMPTLLWLAGLPVPRVPADGPLTDVLLPEARAALPVHRVDSFGAPPPAGEPGEAPLESETREYLKSLGYIE